MKTSVEINGYIISIEENDGIISVNAIKDEEVIEEFTIETEESQGEGEEGEDVRGFGEFGEEEDFDGEDLEDELEGQDDDESEEEEEEKEDEEVPGALESFQSFINKKK